MPILRQFKIIKISVADRDPRSGAILTPWTKIRVWDSFFFFGSWIPDPDPQH